MLPPLAIVRCSGGCLRRHRKGRLSSQRSSPRRKGLGNTSRRRPLAVSIAGDRDRSLRLPMICLGYFATRALPQHGSPVCVVLSVKWHEHVQTP
jgi:hypothetical protein